MSQFHKMTTTAQAVKPLWCICLQNIVGLCIVIQVQWVSDTVFKTLWVCRHYLSTIVGLWTLVQTLWICGHFYSNIVGLWTLLLKHCGFVDTVALTSWVCGFVDTVIQTLWVCECCCSNTVGLWTTVAQKLWVYGHCWSDSVDLWTLLLKHCEFVNTVVQTLGLWTLLFKHYGFVDTVSPVALPFIII